MAKARWRLLKWNWQNVTPLLFGALLVFSNSAGSKANGISFEDEDASGHLTIHIHDATIEDVLKQLAAKYGFVLDGAMAASTDQNMTVTMTGDLPTILDRLLHNRNHSIIRTPGTDRDILRVVLIDSQTGSKLVAHPNSPMAAAGNVPPKARKASKPKNKNDLDRTAKAP